MSERYDPQAVEDAPAKSEYVTRKDIKWVAILGILAALAGYPIYQYANEQKNKKVCSANIKAISEALTQYAQDNDDRYPFLFQADAAGNPQAAASGAPETWATAVGGRLKSLDVFRCPGAEPSEAAISASPTTGTFPITYGLYTDHALRAVATITSPEETILVAETSDLGALGSYDPLPYGSPSAPLHDSFSIGWDNSNVRPNAKTRAVTRLAFRKAENGKFGDESVPRHSAGIHGITVSGNQVLMKPSESFVQWSIRNLVGRWRTQP